MIKKPANTSPLGQSISDVQKNQLKRKGLFGGFFRKIIAHVATLFTNKSKMKQSNSLIAIKSRKANPMKPGEQEEIRANIKSSKKIKVKQRTKSVPQSAPTINISGAKTHPDFHIIKDSIRLSGSFNELNEKMHIFYNFLRALEKQKNSDLARETREIDDIANQDIEVLQAAQRIRIRRSQDGKDTEPTDVYIEAIKTEAKKQKKNLNEIRIQSRIDAPESLLKENAKKVWKNDLVYCFTAEAKHNPLTFEGIGQISHKLDTNKKGIHIQFKAEASDKPISYYTERSNQQGIQNIYYSIADNIVNKMANIVLKDAELKIKIIRRNNNSSQDIEPS